MKKIIALALSVLMLTSALAGCGNETKPGGTSGAGTTQPGSQGTANLEPIKIGSIQDTSGGASLAGQPNQWGVEYAVRWINENGGINGRPVELYSRDCQNDAEVGVTNYRELVDEAGVCAIIGPPLSNPASAWVELATEDKIPIVGHFMDEVCTSDPDTGEAYP